MLELLNQVRPKDEDEDGEDMQEYLASLRGASAKKPRKKPAVSEVDTTYLKKPRQPPSHSPRAIVSKSHMTDTLSNAR